MLSVHDYNKAESAALDTIANRIIEAMAPIAFNGQNYPTRVDHDNALARYVDVMHERRAQDTFNDLLGGKISKAELSDILQIVKSVSQMTEQMFGKRIAPFSSLLRSLLIFRQIRHAAPEQGTLIFEIGHGSGYLGALCVLNGYRYISTDISQAFYLYQSLLLENLIGDQFHELSLQQGQLTDPIPTANGSATHIAWWQYCQPGSLPDASVDVVTCNHALAEMHPNARAYAIKYADMILQRPGGFFIFEGWGSTIHTPIWGVTKCFSDFGFVIPHNDIFCSIQAPENSKWNDGALHLPQAVAPRKPRGFFRQAPDVSPEAELEQAFHPPIFTPEAGELSRRVISGREDAKLSQSIGFEETVSLVMEAAGLDCLDTDDEKFMQWVDCRY